MAQQTKALATMPDCLSLVPKTDAVAIKNNCVSCPLNSMCMPWYTGVETHVNKYNLKFSIYMFSYVCVR